MAKDEELTIGRIEKSELVVDLQMSRISVMNAVMMMYMSGLENDESKVENEGSRYSSEPRTWPSDTTNAIAVPVV